MKYLTLSLLVVALGSFLGCSAQLTKLPIDTSHASKELGLSDKTCSYKLTEFGPVVDCDRNTFDVVSTHIGMQTGKRGIGPLWTIFSNAIGSYDIPGTRNQVTFCNGRSCGLKL